jgi:hypothetical protein
MVIYKLVRIKKPQANELLNASVFQRKMAEIFALIPCPAGKVAGFIYSCETPNEVIIHCGDEVFLIKNRSGCKDKFELVCFSSIIGEHVPPGTPLLKFAEDLMGHLTAS